MSEKVEKTANDAVPSSTAAASSLETQQQQQQQPVSREELTVLVRAIKFAKPEASMRNVHCEISQDLSRRESFGFLRDVTLNDVKRVWKKARNGGAAPAASNTNDTASSLSAERIPSNDKGVVQLYTVGDGTVRTLAQEYSQAAAAAAAQQQEAIPNHYVHVFLDQPADRSGARPHQALISFQNSKTKGTSGNETMTEQKHSEDDNREIVKVQMAASDVNDANKYPMLLYNADRSAKTFVHPDPQDDGYERIQAWVRKEGVGGALGTAGGTKAYFYCHITKRKKGADVVSIDVSQLAPVQPW